MSVESKTDTHNLSFVYLFGSEGIEYTRDFITMLTSENERQKAVHADRVVGDEQVTRGQHLKTAVSEHGL